MNSGTWLQRLWWKIRDLYHQLKPCRFSIVVAIISFFVFTTVVQGVEALRAVGEGLAGGSQWYALRVVFFFVALMLWAVCSWYACRVLLYFDFPNAPSSGARSKWAEANVPRLLGIAPIIILALGFWTASRRHAPEDKTQYWLLGFAALCVLLAISFYVLLAYRREIFRLGAIATVKHVDQLSRGTKTGIAVIGFISVSLFIAFTVAPVAVAQKIGMGTILLLAASSWVV
ncbi:MAG: hypothetical protein DME61_02060, partial [Verrucomicrobia bacterium]